MKMPRCPACRAWLSIDRTIREVWQGSTGNEDLWDYHLACPGCLSVVVIEREATARHGTRPPVVGITGAVVSRVLEKLRDAALSGETASEVERMRMSADADRRSLLRVPEVFALARPAFGREILLAQTLSVMDPNWEDPIGDGSVRLELKAMRGSSAPVGPDIAEVSRHGHGRYILKAGLRLRVRGADGSQLVLEPPTEIRVGELVAYLDLLAPVNVVP